MAVPPTIDSVWELAGRGDLDGAARIAAVLLARDESRGDPRQAFSLHAFLARLHADSKDWTAVREQADAARLHEESAPAADAATLELLRALAENELGTPAARDEALARAKRFAAATVRGEGEGADAARARLRSSFVDDGWRRLEGQAAQVQERALEIWRELLPDDADAAVLHSELLARRGAKNLAEATLDDAVERVESGRSRSHRPHWSRASREAGNGRWAQARSDAEAAAARLEGASAEDARDVLLLVAQARRRTGALLEAEEALDDARRCAPPTLRLHCELGWLHFDEGRHAEAFVEALRAQRLLTGDDFAAAREVAKLLVALDGDVLAFTKRAAGA